MKQFNEIHFNIHDYFDFKVSLHTSLIDLLENITKKLCLSKRSKCNLVGRKIETFNSNLFPLSERGFIFPTLIPKLMIFFCTGLRRIFVFCKRTLWYQIFYALLSYRTLVKRKSGRLWFTVGVLNGYNGTFHGTSSNFVSSLQLKLDTTLRVKVNMEQNKSENKLFFKKNRNRVKTMD